MKTFKDLLSDIAEKESDADYDRRMRKTAKTLKRSARKGKRTKKKNVIRRRDNEKLDTAARAKAKKIVLKSLPDKMKPSAKKKKVDQKAAMIDRMAKKVKKQLKKAEPERIKKAKASKKASKLKK
tara:strand:+ start:115 stop:489 length:375 start_codon:yes stop_codon:yes gene_type:complete